MRRPLPTIFSYLIYTGITFKDSLFCARLSVGKLNYLSRISSDYRIRHTRKWTHPISLSPSRRCKQRLNSTYKRRRRALHRWQCPCSHHQTAAPWRFLGILLRAGRKAYLFLRFRTWHRSSKRRLPVCRFLPKGRHTYLRRAICLRGNMAKKKPNWGHSDHITAVELAARATVRQLIVSHHEPGYSDSKIEEIHQGALRYCKEYNQELSQDKRARIFPEHIEICLRWLSNRGLKHNMLSCPKLPIT